MVPEEMVAWVVLNGIGHAVSADVHGWTHTACKVLTSSRERVARRKVTRVCRKCRTILRDTVLLKKHALGREEE